MSYNNLNYFNNIHRRKQGMLAVIIFGQFITFLWLLSSLNFLLKLLLLKLIFIKN